MVVPGTPERRGATDNRSMVGILWHRRETRRQTENTNLDLQLRKELVYSTTDLPTRLQPRRVHDPQSRGDVEQLQAKAQERSHDLGVVQVLQETLSQAGLGRGA